ncbi:hypothetical protein J437_LFUL000520, partial [Ladona fulva]
WDEYEICFLSFAGQLSSSPGVAGSPAVGGPQGPGSSVKVPAPPIDYSRYVKRFSSAAECGSFYCRDLNYREHFHCLDCNSRVFVKKEEMIRHFKWHKKRDESLQHGFMRYSPMDDCSDRFRDCSHNRKQTHYHCLKEGCEKVYISTSDVQMHANYHRKDSAIIQEGFQRYRATEDCASPHCQFFGQRTTHFHCRRSNCKFTFKNKADMEKHKTYHIKDEQLNRDGFKKFMKHEHCSFENCRFSRVCNHIHCIRLGCSYVLHSSGQLYSHKRKHERKDNEMAYRKFKLAQSMLKSFGGSGMEYGGMPGMAQSASTSPHDFSMDSMFGERVGTPPMGQGGRIQGITPDTSSSPVTPSSIQTSVIQGPSAPRPISPQQQQPQQQQLQQPQQSQESQECGSSSPGRSSPESMPNGLPPGPQGLAAFHKYSSVFGGLDCMTPPGMPSPFLIGTPGGVGAGVPVGAVAGYTPPSSNILPQTPPGSETHPSSSSSAVDLSHADFRSGPVTLSSMMQQPHPGTPAAARQYPLLPEDLWRKYLTCHRAGEKCGGRGVGPNAVCEFLGKEHFHCMAEGCDMTFRSKDGVREHARNHDQQEQVTDAFYWTVEVGQEPCRPCPPDCPFQNKEKHYHCCWENCREIILPTDKPFRRLDHYKMHEYSRKLSLTKDPMTMTLATSIDGMFRRKRGRPPKNRVIEFPVPSTPGTMDVPQAIFASFKLPKPASISANVVQSPPFGMTAMTQGIRVGPMAGTPNPSPPSSSPPRPPPPLSAPPTGSSATTTEKPVAHVQEGFYVYDEGSPCPEGPLCPYCSRRHFHCTQPRCFYVTDREDILIMHSKDFHDNIDIMEGFVFFDRTIDCRLPSCHSNKVNRHFHCTRPNCGYSFVRYSTMAVHEQKHRDEEEGGGPVVGGSEGPEGEEERWEGPSGECTPNGGPTEKRTSPVPSTEREESNPLTKGIMPQNQSPVIRLPCPPNQVVRPGQLSPSTGTTDLETELLALLSLLCCSLTFNPLNICALHLVATTVVKAAGTFYPLSAFSSGRPHGKAAKHEIQTSPRPIPSPTATPNQAATSSPTRSSSSTASSSASSSPPPVPPSTIAPSAQPLRLAVAAWHSPVAGVGRDSTVMTVDGREGSPEASQSNSLANLLQKIPAEGPANQNLPLHQQPTTTRPEYWMDVDKHVKYGPEHSCSRPFCKLKRKEHYHCMACNQAFSELERLRPHIQKHAGGALSPDSSSVPLEASASPRTKDVSVGTVVIKTEQENGGEVDGEEGNGSTEGGSRVETSESSQRTSPQPNPEEHGPAMWARTGPVVGGDPSYPHHFALANPFALVTSRGMPFVGPGMPTIYSSPTGLMFAPALPSLRTPQGSNPAGGVMGEPGDSSVLQQQHPFNSMHRPSLLGKRSSPTAPLHAPLHHLHLSSPHHQFLPPPPNPQSHNPPSPLSFALHGEVLSPEAKKARIQTSMRILKDEPVPDGYIRFRFNEDCKYPHCGYREHQTHFHCMRPDCGYSFCDKTRFVQHTARHERLDTLMGGDFQQFRANVPCGRPDCAYTSTLGSMQNKASHFHCLKCEFVCTDTNKVVAHRRQHQKLDSIMAAGFEKFTPSQTCQVEGCAHSQKQTHYHCLSCHYAVLGLSQMSAHKYRHLE